jgi:hypothetical protein
MSTWAFSQRCSISMKGHAAQAQVDLIELGRHLPRACASSFQALLLGLLRFGGGVAPARRRPSRRLDDAGAIGVFAQHLEDAAPVRLEHDEIAGFTRLEAVGTCDSPEGFGPFLHQLPPGSTDPGPPVCKPGWPYLFHV